MKNNMVFPLLLLTLLTTTVPCHGKNIPPQVGETFPQFILPGHCETSHASYLGIGPTDTFSIARIKAPIVIIEIFSMYCPYCQKEAPSINLLYQKIENDPYLKNKIKIIGIGAGNSPFEVNFFKKKFKVKFPLFPDQDFSIHKLLGQVRTPYFFVIKKNGAQVPLVIYSKLGGIGDVDEFLRKILLSVKSK